MTVTRELAILTMNSAHLCNNYKNLRLYIFLPPNHEKPQRPHRQSIPKRAGILISSEYKNLLQ